MRKTARRLLALLLAAVLLCSLTACVEEEIDLSVCTVCGKEATHEWNGRGWCDQHFVEAMRKGIAHAGWF